MTEGERPAPRHGFLAVVALAASRSLLTQPADGVHQCSQSGPFGKETEIPVADRTLVLDSSQFLRV